MRYLRWICWYLWEGLPTLLAFPIDSSKPSVTGESWFSHWEDHWPRYVIGTFGFVVVAFTLAGCLCCRRQRCPKGFQEFKDGSTAGTETTIERHPSASLELEVPRLGSSSLSSKVQFDGPPIDRPSVVSVVKPKPPSPSLFSDEQEIENNFSREQPCREWFEPGNCHVPRERLKYLREIGRGWFGKVVEGTTESAEGSTRSRGVVVRILTEEATTREKAWFLGEATPYLKLQHPNIPTLLGSCLEADPYLLLFESCPAGDLKGFLRSNRDKGTCEALRSQNVPTRMALDIANALEHMHENGFAHTDLSARNCLVAPDLSAKLGDYGTGVEKYPGDYYVVGDRALPIRWSAPESLECTATTIETRAITPRANLWSYGVLLWEMATWGERPYDDLGDEQVIEMIFSLKTGFSSHGASALMLDKLRDERLEVPCNFREAIEASWKFFPDDRSSLADTRQIICGKRIEDFEKRWENLRPNGAGLERDNRSASLQDLRVGGEPDGRDPSDLRAQFRLGPEEPVANLPRGQHTGQESGSETEEESWRGRVERGAYTEKVKQKSKSVADLMVLVHIDSDSDAEISLGPQNVEKPAKKRLPASGSDGDLKSAVLADEFDEALRKLREPSVCNATSVRTSRSPLECSEKTDNLEKPKLLTLTQQGETPILRLSFGNPEGVGGSTNPEKIGVDDLSHLKNIAKNLTTGIFDRGAADKISSRQEEKSSLDDILEKATTQAPAPRREDERVDPERRLVPKNESPRAEGHLLRLVSKGDPDLPLLRYVPERASTPENASTPDQTSAFDSLLVFQPPQDSSLARFTNDFPASRVPESSVDVALWSDALAFELEKKNPGYDADTTIFESFTNSTILDDREAVRVAAYLTDGGNDGTILRSASAPNTPSRREDFTSQSSSAPDTPRNRHRADVDEDLANGSSAGAYSVGVLDEDSSTCEDLEASERILRGSAPDTPQSRGNYSVGNGDEDSSTCEDLEASERILRGSAPDTPQSRGNYSVGNGDEDSSTCEDLEASERILRGSAPDTPQSRGNYSVGNGDEDSSTGEELGMIKRSSHEAEDEDRKHLSTPDDERSSDSGFRDKESCEEEESPVPGTTASSIIMSGAISSSGFAANSSPLSASAEEEQMRILFELDTILDAEYYGSFHESENVDEAEVLSPSDVRVRLAEGEEIGAKNRSISESLGSTESTDIVETVRANSCEPDFLERSSRDVGPEEERKVEDSRVFGGKEEGKNSWEICDATETDSMSECSLRTDQNQSVDSSPLGLEANKRRDSAVDSERNRGNDSESKIRGSNVDSAEMREKIDGGNGENEGRSSERPRHPENVEKSGESPRIGESDDSEKNRGADSESKIRGSDLGSAEMREKIDGGNGENEVRSSERSRHPENLEKSPRVGESDDSVKNRGNDSESKIRGSDVDSAEMREKIDVQNGENEVRSSERSRHPENLEKSGESPRIGESDDAEKNRGADSPRKIRRSDVDSAEIPRKIDGENESADIEVRSPERSSHSENVEKSGESPRIGESDDSEKNRGVDSSIELCGFNADSSDSREKVDELSGTELRSADRSSHPEKLEKSGETPIIREGVDSAHLDPSTDHTMDSSQRGAPEIRGASEIVLTDSTSQSTLETNVKSEHLEKSTESPMIRKGENSADSDPIIDLTVDTRRTGTSETLRASEIRRASEILRASEIELTDSTSRSPPGTDVKSAEIEKSSGLEDLSSYRGTIDRSSENLEKPGKSEDSTTDLSTIYRSSENLEKPGVSENVTTDLETIDRSCKNLEKPGVSEDSTTDLSMIYRSSENLEKPAISENLTTDLETIDRSSENLEKPGVSEDSTTDLSTIYRSSENLEKPGVSEDSTTDLSTIYRSSENLEKPSVSENLTTNLSKIYRSSENLEKPCESENSATDFSKIYRSSENLEKPCESENSTTNLSKIYRSSENLEKPCESENSTTDLSKIYRSSENLEKPCESANSTTDLSPIYRSSENVEKPTEASDVCEGSDVDLENSTSDSPLKTGCRRASDLSTETREADSLRSDGEQWSSRENVDENDDEEDSSTMSLRSDNSYVSFGLDEEFVAAIRNELREKLPRAQMPVVEALDPRDEKEPSINEDAETKRWEDEEAEDNSERGSGGVDISIRYNIYGTPLSPILEERESAGTSESLVSKEDSRDASIASRVSALSEDVLVVDTLTNRAMMLDGTASGNGESSNLHQDDDRDTSHGDFSDEENLEYPQNNLNRGMESKRIPMASGGAPLPSPEEETKWQQQFPLPLQMQDDLMSTSFGTDRDWDSQDDDEGDDDGEDGEEDEEENSSSSGEFVWKRYDESHGDLENVATRSPPNKPKSQEPEADLDEEDEGDEDDEEEEEEFTPSAWDATLAPHRSALRSPEKTPKSGDQKKSVWFKKQRYHCVYEYPKETPVAEGQGQAATTWEPTSYADWEEMMDEPRLDVYPMEYDETNRAGDEEFYVSSSNRPFQFQSGEGKYVSQFFPGASSTLLQQQQQQQQQPPASREGEDCQESQDEVDRAEIPLPPPAQTNGNSRGVDPVDSQQQIQQSQLGELRHTRDRLKLNLLSTGGAAKAEEDIGNENRSQEVEGTEISEKETSLIPNNKTEAPADEKSSRIPEELSKCDKPSELKIPKTEIVEDRSTKMAKSPENTSEEKRSLVSKKTIEIVEDSSRKSEKLPNDRLKDESAERRIEEESSKSAKELEGGKSIVAAIGEKSTSKEENVRSDIGGASSRPKNRDNLAVREASKEFFMKADGTRDALPSDYSAVIQGKDETDGAVEISSSNYNSRTIGDQKDSSNTRIVEATGDTVVAGQIVDITKLETEESPANARRHRVEGNSVIVEKSESTEVSSVPDASAVPSTIYSPDDKTHEDFVRSSQS